MKNLSYELISKNPSDLKRLTGLSVAEFQTISAKAKPLWDKKIVMPKKVSGRPWAIGGLEDHILALLIYYRFYVPHTFLGMMFGIDDSAICRSLKRIEPVLSRTTTFKKNANLSKMTYKSLSWM